MDKRPATGLCSISSCFKTTAKTVAASGRGIICLLVLTAWSSPRLVEQADFRASLRIKPIVSSRVSPALAALEDSRANFSRGEPDIIEQHTSTTLAQLKTGKKFNWNARPARQMALPPTVISQDTRIAHMRELVGEVDEKPATAVTVTDYAEILVKEELLRRAHANNSAARVITSATGNSITILPPTMAAAATPLRRPIAKVNIVVPHKNTPAKPVVLAANFRALQSANPFAPEQFEISGALTFEKGAAMLGGKQNLIVQQITDGQVAAAGDINFVDASYHIIVTRLEGELVADLRDQNGMLMAEGKCDLSALAESHLNQHRIRDISMSIVPATSSTEAVVVAAGALGEKKKPLANAQLRIEELDRALVFNKKENAFVDKTLVAPSTFLVRADAPNYWPTIGLAQSGERFQLQLLPLKVIEALLSLTLDKYSAREAIEQGIIWGHVTMGGHPIEGAQVSVVGETEAAPIYFTGFIPDKTRHSTAPSGEYAFTRLEAGEKMLRVNLAEKIFWPVLLPIQNKSVTYADLQIEPRRGINFVSSFAFTATPTEAQVQPLGTADEMMIPASGAVRIENETISGTSFFEGFVDPTHEMMRVSLRPGQAEVHFPFVTKEWMDKARSKFHLPSDAQTGSAIFFTNGDDYDVIVGASAGERAQNIVYFDGAGHFTDRPADGGGFVILNLPPGFHTITIIPEKSKKIVTQLVYADAYAVAAETVNLMY